jgi:ureidoglycolate lyase
MLAWIGRNLAKLKGRPVRKVTTVPITAAAFAPFGDVLHAPSPPPRQDHAGLMINGRRDARANCAVIRSEPYDPGKPLQRLECHPHSNQLFVPLSVGRYLVVVAPDRDGRPDEDGLLAYDVGGDTGINYHPGIWHAHMTTLDRPGTFAMLVHEDGTAQDCLFAPITDVTLVVG